MNHEQEDIRHDTEDMDHLLQMVAVEEDMQAMNPQKKDTGEEVVVDMKVAVVDDMNGVEVELKAMNS